MMEEISLLPKKVLKSEYIYKKRYQCRLLLNTEALLLVLLFMVIIAL